MLGVAIPAAIAALADCADPAASMKKVAVESTIAAIFAVCGVFGLLMGKEQRKGVRAHASKLLEHLDAVERMLEASAQQATLASPSAS